MGTTKTPGKLNRDRKSNEKERNTKKNDENNEMQDMQRMKKKGSSRKSNVNEKLEERNQETEQWKHINQSNKNGNKKQRKRKRNEKDENEEEELKLSAFPMHRVETIMKSEGSDLKMNQEAYFLINKAMEKFMQQFCEDAYDLIPARDWRGIFKYKHLSSIVNENRYEFLSDFVPAKIKFEDALKEIKPTETSRGKLLIATTTYQLKESHW